MSTTTTGKTGGLTTVDTFGPLRSLVRLNLFGESPGTEIVAGNFLMPDGHIRGSSEHARDVAPSALVQGF